MAQQLDFTVRSSTWTNVSQPNDGKTEQGRKQARWAESTGLQRPPFRLSWYTAEKVKTTANNKPTGTVTDRFMIAPSAMRSKTTPRPY